MYDNVLFTRRFQLMPVFTNRRAPQAVAPPGEHSWTNERIPHKARAPCRKTSFSISLSLPHTQSNPHDNTIPTHILAYFLNFHPFANLCLKVTDGRKDVIRIIKWWNLGVSQNTFGWFSSVKHAAVFIVFGTHFVQCCPHAFTSVFVYFA